MSVAFTREESAETAAEVELPDRPISPHPNLVTASGLEALTNAMSESRTAYETAQRIEGRCRTSSRRRGRYSGHEIFRRSSQDSSGRSAVGAFRHGRFRASCNIQARRRQAPCLQDRRGRRSGSSEWIDIVCLPRRAGSDGQSRG